MFSPFKFVAEATTQYAQSAMRNRRANGTLHAVDALVRSRFKKARWHSEFLERQAITKHRADEIVDAIFYDKHARREMKRSVEGYWRRGSGAFWDIYLRRTANSVLPFSDGYQSLIQLVNSCMATEGTVADWNCGSGLMLAALSAAVPERKPVAISANPRATVATRRLFKNLFGTTGPLNSRVLNFEDENQNIPVANAAFMQDVLMMLESDASKIEMLKRVADSLDVGGRLLLVEPKPTLQKQSILRLWLGRIAKEAALNHAPANEHDLALFIEMNRRVFGSAEATFSTTSELVELAKEAGLEPILVRDAMYGHYSAILLRRLPPKPKSNPIIRYHDDPE